MLTTTKTLAAAAAFAGALTLAIPAQAEYGRNAAAAAGAIGGLAVGAAIAGAGRDRPVRHYEVYDDGPRCHIERRRIQLDEDTYRVQRIRVCD